MKTETVKIPEKLIDAIEKGKCVLFAGAGLSRGIRTEQNSEVEQYLPGWGELLIVLILEAKALGLFNHDDVNTLKKAVKERKYLFVSETVRRKMGDGEYYDALQKIFRNPNLKPTERHYLISQIPFSAILSTNYDKLLESAYAQHGTIPPTYTFDDAADVISALSHDRFFIMKLHGDIDRKSSIVLSERDYREIIYRQPGYIAALNTIFITKTVLFIGTSLSDMDVKLVLETVNETFNGKVPRHYALVPDAEISDVEIQHWRDFFGIHFIPYKATKGHPEIDEFLKQVKNVMNVELSMA